MNFIQFFFNFVRIRVFAKVSQQNKLLDCYINRLWLQFNHNRTEQKELMNRA